jgi:hypothetical protein
VVARIIGPLVVCFVRRNFLPWVKLQLRSPLQGQITNPHDMMTAIALMTAVVDMKIAIVLTIAILGMTTDLKIAGATRTATLASIDLRTETRDSPTAEAETNPFPGLSALKSSLILLLPTSQRKNELIFWKGVQAKWTGAKWKTMKFLLHQWLNAPRSRLLPTNAQKQLRNNPQPLAFPAKKRLNADEKKRKHSVAAQIRFCRKRKSESAKKKKSWKNAQLKRPKNDAVKKSENKKNSAVVLRKSLLRWNDANRTSWRPRRLASLT